MSNLVNCIESEEKREIDMDIQYSSQFLQFTYSWLENYNYKNHESISLFAWSR